MADEVRLLSEGEIAQFAQIAIGAYPSFTITADELAQRMLRDRGDDPSVKLYGLFRDGALLGGMAQHDFTLYYHGIALPIGGVALVAVDLLHKKERVAKELLGFFLRHYRERGASLAALYPFRPDFYRKMGFGYGTKLNHYRLRPDSFPRGPSRAHLRHLARADGAALLACYQRYAMRTHGLFERSSIWVGRLFDNANQRVLAYLDGETVQGYLIYQFQRGANFLQNNLQVVELVAEHPTALSELLTFLHSQADQITSVVLNTQDDQLHHLVEDPRNGTGNLHPSVYHETNAQGVGIMYRVIELAGFFRALAAHNFGGQSLTLQIACADSFLPENAGAVTVQFAEGRPSLAPAARPDARISLPVAQLSSLLLGAVDFRSLLSYGLAEIDNPNYSDTVHRLFLSDVRPVCLTAF